MDKRIADLLKKYNLCVIFRDTHQKGFLLKSEDYHPSVIVVNSKLSEAEADKTILHEIGHYLKDDDVIGDYTKDKITHDCSEHGANNFMISEQVRHYVALGNDASTTNWVTLAESIGTDDFLQVQKELKKYLPNSEK